MTSEQRIQIGEAWMALATVYGREIQKPALTMMLNAISDLPAEKVLIVMNDWMKEAKNRSHPLPGDIREKIFPILDDKAVAIETARRLDKCVSKFGWTWEQGYFREGGNYWEDLDGKRHDSFKEAVVASVGAIGWHVICARGGWQNLRNSANEMEEGMFIAQTRDHVASSLQLQRAGVDIAKISLPSTSSPKLELVNSSAVVQNLLNGASNRMPKE